MNTEPTTDFEKFLMLVALEAGETGHLDHAKRMNFYAHIAFGGDNVRAEAAAKECLARGLIGQVTTSSPVASA